jgi:predicted nucleic acid-binding protein
LSSQVIGEVCVNLIRKANFDETRIRQLISRFYYDHEVVSIEHGILLKASELREQHPFSFWDSVVVSSALAANASILYSEDMQDGLLLERRLKIANPIKNQIV